MENGMLKEGFVISKKGAYFYVVSGERIYRCSLRGKFRLGDKREEVLPVVGDNVEFREEKSETSGEPSGLIVAISPRKSIFARSSSTGKLRYRVLCANLDYVFLVFAVLSPACSGGMWWYYTGYMYKQIRSDR